MKLWIVFSSSFIVCDCYNNSEICVSVCVCNCVWVCVCEHVCVCLHMKLKFLSLCKKNLEFWSGFHLSFRLISVGWLFHNIKLNESMIMKIFSTFWQLFIFSVSEKCLLWQSIFCYVNSHCKILEGNFVKVTVSLILSWTVCHLYLRRLLNLWHNLLHFLRKDNKLSFFHFI